MNEVRIEKTGQPDVVSTSDGRLTLSVPIQIKRRGGRKVVRLPDGNTLKPRPINDKPTPIQMALARGHRWLAMLESGEAENLTEVAEREGMDRAYVSRMVNLTTLAPDIVALIENAERLTAGNGGLMLTVALSYGGRQEIAQAARALAAKVAAGEIDPAAIDEGMVADALETSGIPDPDLMIRTSGEKRISNFLLWQTAYSELVFLDVLWPDFGREHLEEAIREYHRRERRFGTAVG